jgi:hypothetical protein
VVQEFNWPDLSHISVLQPAEIVKRLRPDTLDWVTQGQEDTNIWQQFRDSFDLPGFQTGITGRNFAANRLWFQSTSGFEMAFIPGEIVLKHLPHEKEVHFLGAAYLYIRMQLQNFVEPG